MDRYRTPAEVALYLASSGASYVRGHVLAVDGDFLAAGVLNKPTSVEREGLPPNQSLRSYSCSAKGAASSGSVSRDP